MNPLLWLAPGVQVAEDALLAELAAQCEKARRAPALLARPVRIVVPSKSLRVYLAARVAEALGGAAVGVVVQTLHAVALEVLSRTGERVRRSQALLPVLVRQEARREPVLNGALESLRDGYAVVVASVSDLLDAGFDPTAGHLESADECLDTLRDAPAVETAGALVRVAARVHARFRELDLWHRSQVLIRARESLEKDAELLLPARAVYVYGFADATGVAAEFLQVLLRGCGAQYFCVRPTSLVGGVETSAGENFTVQLFERLRGVAELRDLSAATAELAYTAASDVEASVGPVLPELTCFCAPGVEAEVREVARRVQKLFDAGVHVETIGVVARELVPYTAALRIHFARLGIPFSGAPGVVGPLTPAGRALRALLFLLERREATPTDRWLELVFRSDGRSSLSDLRVALHYAGAGRLAGVSKLNFAELAGGAATLPLPVRRGFAAEEAGDVEAEEDENTAVFGAARRRHLPVRVLAEAVSEARKLCAYLQQVSARAPFSVYCSWLRAMANETLPAFSASEAGEELSKALRGLEAEIPTTVEIELEDFTALLRGATRERGREPLAGLGGGVQVLGVMEARFRRFEHLFVMGLNRDVFPRVVSEEALFPDRIRRALLSLLPDLPVKERGHAEERYLFAQLLTASPSVILSYLSVDDDGRERAPSPLLTVLRHVLPVSPPLAPALCAPPQDKMETRLASEAAVLAGVHGTSQEFAALLPFALREARVAGDAERLAEVRLRILTEMEPPFSRRTQAGPYLGFIGALCAAEDPRRTPLFVSTLEKLAACPWQTFLQKLLRLEPIPDALEELPGIDRRLLGAAVHAALEEWVRARASLTKKTLEEVRQIEPILLPEKIDGAELERSLQVAARRVLREAGFLLPGFERILVEQARSYVKEALRLQVEGAVCLGAEIEGFVVLPNGGHIHFRADRVDREAGRLLLTDYKTGKPISTALQESTRSEHWLKNIAGGKHLQAVAYALGAAQCDAKPAAGCFLFLDPHLPNEYRRFSVTSDDTEVMECFTETVCTLLAAWRAGIFPPRVSDPAGKQEPRRCEDCEFSTACLRGDSGARRRLLGFGQAAPEAEKFETFSVWRALWKLTAKPTQRSAPEAEGIE